MLGLPIGIALSFLIGGYIAKNYGWQQAFFVAAIPGFLCAVAAWFLKEPLRGASEAHAVGAAKREGSPIKLVLSIPSIWPIVASGALHNFNMYAIGSLHRAAHHPLSQGRHRARPATISMPIYGLSGIPGLLFGGVLADALTKRWAGGRMVLSAAMFFIAAPLTYVALLAGPGEKMAFAVPMGLGVAAMYVYYSATYSTIQDLVEPSLRGMAMAVYFCAMYLLGASLGPMLLGKLSDHYTIAAAAAAGVTEVTPAALEPFRGAGLHTAMYVVPMLNLALTGCMLIAAKTVPADIAKMQAWMRESAGKAPAQEKPAVAVAEART